MMMTMELEFIRRRRVPWAGLAFFAITLIVGAAVFWKWNALRAEEESKEAHIQALEDEWKHLQQVAKAQEDVSPEVQQKKKSEEKIVASLAYPWNRVLADMEQSNVEKTAILSFSHDQGSGETQLSVEAADVPALVRFVDKMNEGDNRKRWYIASYQVQTQNMPVTVKATVLAK
jgi:hypothetical protein